MALVARSCHSQAMITTGNDDRNFFPPRFIWAGGLTLILVATAFLYGRLWNAEPLTWDDDFNIFNNPYYAAGDWLRFWRESYYGLYVPVTSTLWAWLFAAGAGSPIPFRIFNVCLHALNAGLVFLLLKSLSRHWRMESPWAVLAGTAFFAWHPLQVESVAWISGGRDLLAVSFALSAALCYFRGGSPRLPWMMAATGLFVLSLLSKPSGAVLPVVFLLVDFVVRPEEVRRTSPWLAVWLVMAGAVVWATRGAQADYLIATPLWQRPLIMLDAFQFHLGKTLAPWPLATDYERTPQYVWEHSREVLIPSLTFAFALLAMQTWAFFRERRVNLFWAWILLLLPVSGIAPFSFQKISTTADHYNYLALVVPAAFLMWAVSFAISRRHALLGAVPAALALAAALLVSFLRVPVWASEEAFFSDMAEQAPNSYSAAIGMSIVECERRHDYDKGVYWTEVALKSRPNDMMALANQAYCLLHAQNYLRVIELDFYLGQLNLQEMEEKQPAAYSSFLASIGTAQIEMKAYEEGYQYLCEAYRVKPNEPGNIRNLEIATRILTEQGLEASCATAHDGFTDEPYEDLDDNGDGVEKLFPGSPDEEENPD